MDLSVVVNLHREGMLAVPCLNSLRVAIAEARGIGIDVEAILVLDRTDALTTMVAEDCQRSWEGPVQIITLDVGDLAAARNAGVSAAGGTFVAFADGDDLYSANWLSAAVEQARRAPQGEITVIHPAAAFFFGHDYRILWSADSSDLLNLGVDGLLRDNFWISTMLTTRQLLIDAPLVSRSAGRYGFEDWSWYLAREADGVCHRVARGTVHCVRLKPPHRSLNKESAAQGEIPHPTRFLAEMLMRRDAIPEGQDTTWQASQFEGPGRRLTRLLSTRRKASADASDPPVRSPIHVANGAALPSWDEERYVQDNLDVRQAIQHGVLQSGLEHYSRFGWREGRRAFMQGDLDPLTESDIRPCPELSTTTYVPHWLCAHLDALASVEPLLSRELRRAPWLWNPHRRSGTLGQLRAIARDLDGIDVLVLVPFLGLGGADLAAVELATGVAGCGLSVAVMSTEGAVSSARRGALELHGIRVLEATGDSGVLEPRVLAELLATTDVRWVHVLNSQIGWDSIRHIRSLTSARVTVSVFCYDFEPSGKPVGFLSRLEEVAPYLASVATDNSAIPPYVNSCLGLSDLKVVKLRHHISPGRPFAGPLRSRMVLWAGRLDRQKNVPRLLAVARQLPDVRFHVYGSSVTDGIDVSTIDWPSNVEYRGPFGRFDDIPRDYGAFFYTSLWDGLPNILIEAAQCGIPIIAPRVGGIGIDLPERWMAIYPSAASPTHIARLVADVLARPREWDFNASQLSRHALKQHSLAAAQDDIRSLVALVGPTDEHRAGGR